MQHQALTSTHAETRAQLDALKQRGDATDDSKMYVCVYQLPIHHKSFRRNERSITTIRAEIEQQRQQYIQQLKTATSELTKCKSQLLQTQDELVLMKRQHDDMETENRELNMKLHRTSALQKNGRHEWGV
jgi:hypothetical protein